MRKIDAKVGRAVVRIDEVGLSLLKLEDTALEAGRQDRERRLPNVYTFPNHERSKLDSSCAIWLDRLDLTDEYSTCSLQGPSRRWSVKTETGEKLRTRRDERQSQER
jgi:hypothetical protein